MEVTSIQELEEQPQMVQERKKGFIMNRGSSQRRVITLRNLLWRRFGNVLQNA